ncbi:MAG: hypothetical protein H7Y14_12980 [Burkholderiales bacterium]|nr:hypothetical protein [Burkholderiales bacterium]
MRDRPDVDELAAPPSRPARRIDGLTDGEWAERRLRRDLWFRIAFGLMFGLGVGFFSIWHWGFLASRFRVAAVLVVLGSMVLFAALFARRRDTEALGYAGWIAFTEWKALENLPWWMIAALGAALFAVVFLMAAVLVLGRFPSLGW